MTAIWAGMSWCHHDSLKRTKGGQPEQMTQRKLQQLIEDVIALDCPSIVHVYIQWGLNRG